VDTRRPAAEVYIMLGTVSGPECDHLWPCVLLDLCAGLGQGESRVSALQTECITSENIAFAIVLKITII
jgi:hypothetical protein